MARGRSTLRTLVATIAGAGLAVGASGCGWFEDPTPDEVRIIATGDAGKEVTIVVSQEFATAIVGATGGTQVQLFAADTLVRALPFDTIMPLLGGPNIGDAKRFFFEARRADEDVSSFQAQVYLDTELRFDRGGALRTERYRFAYVFNELLSEIVEVI